MTRGIFFLSFFMLVSPLRCNWGENDESDVKRKLDVKVLTVADGDSFTAFVDGRQQKFRIFGIDAPEKGMPFYKVSKQKLASLIGGKHVQADVVETDRYKRSVAKIILPDGRDVASEMLKSGLAWHYLQYSKNPQYGSLEKSAREKRIGLWQDANPSPPWKVRQARRGK